MAGPWQAPWEAPWEAGLRGAACATAAAAPEGGGGAHKGDRGVAVELQSARHAAALDGEARAREERVREVEEDHLGL